MFIRTESVEDEGRPERTVATWGADRLERHLPQVVSVDPHAARLGVDQGAEKSGRRRRVLGVLVPGS